MHNMGLPHLSVCLRDLRDQRGHGIGRHRHVGHHGIAVAAVCPNRGADGSTVAFERDLTTVNRDAFYLGVGAKIAADVGISGLLADKQTVAAVVRVDDLNHASIYNLYGSLIGIALDGFRRSQLKARGLRRVGERKVVDMICQKVQCNRDQAADVLIASLPNYSWEEIVDSSMDYLERSYFTEDMVGDIDVQDRSKGIREILDKLTDRERIVLTDRYGLDDNVEKTLEQVGQKLGITRERVRQIEEKALKKLRHPSRSKKLKIFLS